MDKLFLENTNSCSRGMGLILVAMDRVLNTPKDKLIQEGWGKLALGGAAALGGLGLMNPELVGDAMHNLGFGADTASSAQNMFQHGHERIANAYNGFTGDVKSVTPIGQKDVTAQQFTDSHKDSKPFFNWGNNTAAGQTEVKPDQQQPGVQPAPRPAPVQTGGQPGNVSQQTQVPTSAANQQRSDAEKTLHPNGQQQTPELSPEQKAEYGKKYYEMLNSGRPALAEQYKQYAQFAPQAQNSGGGFGNWVKGVFGLNKEVNGSESIGPYGRLEDQPEYQSVMRAAEDKSIAARDAADAENMKGQTPPSQPITQPVPTQSSPQPAPVQPANTGKPLDIKSSAANNIPIQSMQRQLPNLPKDAPTPEEVQKTMGQSQSAGRVSGTRSNSSQLNPKPAPVQPAPQQNSSMTGALPLISKPQSAPLGNPSAVVPAGGTSKGGSISPFSSEYGGTTLNNKPDVIGPNERSPFAARKGK